MPIHINAEKDQVDPVVILPGDPKRAQWMANTFMRSVVKTNEIRNMYGLRGTYNDTSLTVQASGMGQPSATIYIHELIHDYNVKTIIRMGTCGSLRADLQPGTILLAQSAGTDSNMTYFDKGHVSPCPDYQLLHHAYNVAQKSKNEVRVGPVWTSDYFYNDNDDWKNWAKYGVHAVEMETYAVYLQGMKNNIRTLSILMVSDSLVTGEAMTPKKRETGLESLATLTLDIAASFKESE